MQPLCCHTPPAPPPACHRFESSASGLFYDSLLFFKGCLWWEITDVNRNWKPPSFALGAAASLEVVSLGTGLGERLVALTPVCRTRLAWKPAGGRASLATLALVVLTGERNSPATPKTHSQDSSPQMLVGLSVLLRASLSCLSVCFVEVLSSRASTSTRQVQLSLQQLLGWGSSRCMEVFSGLLRGTCVLLTLGSSAVEMKTWVQFPENNFSYFNMKW